MSFGVWAPFKELAAVVNSAISQRQAESCYALENVLKKHKPDFNALLKNPPPNPVHRANVQKATKEGVKISSLPQPLILTQDFIDESLILSNVLDLNELSSVELLLASEQSQPDFPRLTRGLVAVLLYYDGRRSLVTSLRSLVQARDGVLWTLGLSSLVVSVVTTFTDYLFQNGMVDKILSLLGEINVKEELDKLSKARGIKDARHCQQISDLIEEQRNALADTLFYWACQNPFPKDVVLKILDCLKKIPAKEEIQPLDYTTLSLFLTLLACFNIGDASIDSPSLDSSLVDDHYPILSDSGLLSAVHQEVKKNDWSYPALGAAVNFAWGVLLRECSPLDAFRDQSEIEDDEELVEAAIGSDALKFLSRAVIGSSHFHQEEYYVRRIHQLLCSFIVLMPVKVADLRNQGEEAAREVMLRTNRGIPPPPQLRQDFGELMKLIGELYQEDPNSLELSLEYWAPTETDFQGTMRSRTAHRQLSLLKFIHQCSDLLPSGLFQPFMKMLLGLSSCAPAARHCFNFLKANCPSLGGGGASATISLDHFFASLRQYYLDLREGGAASRHTPTGCAISPQELEGLLSVLKVIGNIARLDKDAREVIYESQEWRPVASLFGLLGCGVPIILKAEIFNALAMFAKSPEIAAYMWHTLEVIQILNTGPGMVGATRGQFSLPATSREGSIQIELEEIETQLEEYHETRAFLALLDSLTDVPIPHSLGLGSRVPGFQPYLEFVRDSVFLKFDSRGYKHSQEKWQVACAALEVLLKLLQFHEVTPNDFIEQDIEIPGEGGGVTRLPWKPGHSLLLHMLNDTPLLRKVLFIVDECCQLLADVERSSEDAARAALLSLQMVETALSKQEDFLSVLRQSSTHCLTATPLDELLLAINPRSKKADHFVSIARYVSLSSHSPELALSATRILCLSCRSVYAAREMAKAIVTDVDASVEILHGFVEHLEWDEPGFEAPAQLDSWEESAGQTRSMESPSSVRAQLKVDILKLLVFCLGSPSPGIAHFLLGFQIGKKMGDTQLQDPGVLGCPKTCLHVILALVSIGPDPRSPIGCHLTHPTLAEHCYKLLHCMCSSRDISTPTLRYLRNNHDFFFTQLKSLPFLWLSETGKSSSEQGMIQRNIFRRQQAWALQTVALEVRMTAVRKQRSHIVRLISMFLHPTLMAASEVVEQSHVTSRMADWTGVDLDSTAQELPLGQDGRRKAIMILDHVDFSPTPLPPLPELRFFEDRSRMEEVIRQCAAAERDKAPCINVKVLHRLLMNELSSLHGAAVISQKQCLEEIKEILAVVVRRNGIGEAAYSQQLLFTSWSQLVEVTLHALVGGGGEWEEPGRIAVLFDLIQDLLLKVEHCEPGQLSAAVHGTVMILMAHLRQEVTSMANQTDKIGGSYLSPVHTGPLQSILRGLLDSLLRCPAGMQQLRAFLYSSLLCYFRITQDEDERSDWRDPGMSGRWRLRQDPTGLKDGNIAVLTSFGDRLMDTVCRDACSGHDIAKMLALSLLDALATMGLWDKWLQFMMGQGYLQSLCASLQWENEILQKMLHPVPEALRALFVHESKMAFLIRVASTVRGAQELLTANCLGYLTGCSFIDQRPDIRNISNGGSSAMAPHNLYNTAGFVPSVSGRYLQLFTPVLRLLLAFVSTPGPQQKDARSQVVSFVTAHLDVFVNVLKESHTPITIATLQELSLVTSIVSQCRAGHDFSMSPDSAQLLRLQRLMLSLLPHYLTVSSWKAIAQDVVRVEEGVESSGGRGYSTRSPSGGLWEEALSLAQRVSTNLVAYCVAAMNTGDLDMTTQQCRILFSPCITDSLGAQTLHREAYSSSSPPSLSLLVVALRESGEGYFSVLEGLQQLRKKRESLNSLTGDELRQLVPDSVPDKSKLSPSHIQSLASRGLTTLISGKEQQLQQFTYIVEHLLCVLWRHLQFYLIHCKPMELEPGLGLTGLSRPGMRRMQEPVPQLSSSSASGGFDITQLSEGVRISDLEQLKVDVVKVLTDALLSKLLDLNEAQSQQREETAGIGFIQALVRRIKRLLKLKAAVKPVWQL